MVLTFVLVFIMSIYNYRYLIKEKKCEPHPRKQTFLLIWESLCLCANIFLFIFIALTKKRPSRLTEGYLGKAICFCFTFNKFAQKKAGVGTMWFYYDANGKRVAFTDYNGYYYYYIYNAMGDVIGLYDQYGDVIYYHYDSWGKLVSITNVLGEEITYGSAKWTIAQENPFRYRGYMYDNNTMLYYLNSRYYDPETGRFLNADSILDNRSLVGNNLYGYCWNNHVNMVDYTGQLPCFINEQNYDTPVPGTDLTMGEIKWVWGNIADNGCGVIAIFNVLLTTNANISFLSVRDKMLIQEAALGFGLLGVCPAPISKILKLSTDYQVEEHTLFNQSAWVDTANRSSQVIILYKLKGTMGMHYIYGMRCFPTTNGACNDHYFMFYNEGFADPVQHKMTMSQFLDYLEDKGRTPIWLWGIYK